MVLDSHTIPIIFGTIELALATLAIVVNIAFGVLQLRAANKRTRGDLEFGKSAPSEPAASGVRCTAQPIATALSRTISRPISSTTRTNPTYLSFICKSSSELIMPSRCWDRLTLLYVN